MVTMIDPASVRRAMPQGSIILPVKMPDGWLLRAFDWPQVSGAPRGSILFMGGRGDFFEKYLESFADFHNRGWHVSAFDWRGQGGSGRLTSNTRVGHAQDFGTWIDDLVEIFKSWKAMTKGPHVLMAHSMGGHLLMRGLCEARITPDAAVAIAPMMGFADSPLPKTIAMGMARRLADWLGANRFAWPSNERPSLPRSSRQALLTHDDVRYADEGWWKAEKPELELGPPSWPWVSAAYRSMEITEMPNAAESIQTPTLIIGTDGDRLVSPAAIRAFAARLPNGELKMFDKDVAHEILRERDGPRGEALATIEAFLDAKAPRR